MIGIKNELNSELIQIIPVKGFPITSTWHLIWHKSKKFSPVAQSFLNYINDEKIKIIAEKFSWINDF
jgi:DNA-binding transcriptional LysR family regulator